MEKLAEKIFAQIKKTPLDVRPYQDMFDLCRMDEAGEYAHVWNKQMREILMRNLRATGDKTGFFELYRKSLLFDAPVDFDSYLIYLEMNRNPSERFYLPRRKVMKQLIDAMQDLADDKLDELFLSMPPRVGKLLADDTPVLTTEGWKNHGDLKVGDMVFAPDGNPVPVIGVLPKHHTTHTVTFTDGSQFKCHFRHEWKVYDRRFGKVRILETQEMMGKLENRRNKGNHRGHRYNFQITERNPISGVPVDLKVKPYTLGAWLGDGSNEQPRITGVDPEIIESIERDGYKISASYINSKTGVPSFDFSGLREALQNYNMCYSRHRCEKHIPQEYLYAPVEDRLGLLAGLLDTDGCLRSKENRYDFTTSDVSLKESFMELVASFGWRASVKQVEPSTSSSGITARKVYWVISFNPSMIIPCRLERKLLKNVSRQRKIAIKSIEPSAPEQGNCITVAGGMYLAGRNLTPTHNTSVLMFYVTWLMGRDSEKANLYCAYSDTITKAFYNGILEIINDPATYLWHDVFPEQKIVATNSQEETINVDRRKRYPTITARSLYGTLNGAVDVNGILISDDLIGGIEEALNKDRMLAAWSKVDNNMLTRAKGGCKLLWCGTRWSIIDPAGIRMEMLENDERFRGRRYRIINLSALDEHDESQFEYDYNVGFSTDYYHQRRASFERNNDMASWLAQYMGEPIERDGALFSPDDFMYYNGELPEGEPDRVFMAVDPAFGGGDYVASPVCFQYGMDIYVVDVVYDNNDKKVTQPLLVDAVKKYGVQAMQIEATKATEAYKEGVEDALKKQGIRINMTTKAAPTNKAKAQRIYDKAPDIREHFIFLENGKRNKPYSLFMQNVFSFKIVGKNKNDDAPDSLTMAANMVLNPGGKVEVFRRKW